MNTFKLKPEEAKSLNKEYRKTIYGQVIGIFIKLFLCLMIFLILTLLAIYIIEILELEKINFTDIDTILATLIIFNISMCEFIMIILDRILFIKFVESKK